MKADRPAESPEVRVPISVFYIAAHEQDRLGRSLREVVGWARDVVVVLQDESDPTVEVARQAGARVVFHPWQGFGRQKRFGEEQCGEKWLLNLDADEVVSPELREDIAELFRGGAEPSCEAYRFPIVFQFAFEDCPKKGAYFNDPVRLYDRSRARFRDHPVHDSVIPLSEGADWKVGRLSGEVWHVSFRDLSHVIAKLNSYSSDQARDFVKKGRVPSGWRTVLEPVISFPKAYFLRGYWRYGVHGFAYSVLWSAMRLARVAKARELVKLEGRKGSRQ